MHTHAVLTKKNCSEFLAITKGAVAIGPWNICFYCSFPSEAKNTKQTHERKTCGYAPAKNGKKTLEEFYFVGQFRHYSMYSGTIR